MRRDSLSHVILRAAVWCVLVVCLPQCSADPDAEACDAGCGQGQVCQDGGCLDEACVGVACPDGEVCAGGQCTRPEPTVDPDDVKSQWGPKRDLGASCATGLDCLSNACVDGVCCDTACDGSCEACDVPGEEGLCTVLSRGASCDDGNACTTGDACDGATAQGCAGTQLACDTPPGQCYQAAGTCSKGTCTYVPKPAGTACDDGNACTSGEACGADGQCGGGTVKVCDTPPDVCFQAQGTCLPQTGACTYGFRAQGTECRSATGVCDAAEVCTGSAGACPADGFRPEGTSCSDDGNACTTDVCNGSGGCGHPALVAGTPCGAGSVCNATPQCVAGCWIDGAFRAPGTTNPAGECQVCDPSRSTTAWSFKLATTVCRGSTGTCDAVEYCTGSSAQCPGDGSVANGTSCGSGSTGAWSGCGGYAGTCGESGTQSRSVTTQACFNGTCQSSTSTQTQACSRDTDGFSCGAGTSYGGWSGCGGYDGTCGEFGTQSRSVTTYECGGGACQGYTYTEEQGCSRSTSGLSCGGTSYGSWSACVGSGGTCSPWGTQSRSVTLYSCGGGACQGSTYTETQSCSLNTTGTPCDDGNSCTTGDVCNGSGSCVGAPCPSGTTCSNGICTTTTPCGPGETMCGSTCVDTSSNTVNCGGCGIRCGIGQTCRDSRCVACYGQCD